MTTNHEDLLEFYSPEINPSYCDMLLYIAAFKAQEQDLKIWKDPPVLRRGLRVTLDVLVFKYRLLYRMVGEICMS